MNFVTDTILTSYWKVDIETWCFPQCDFKQVYLSLATPNTFISLCDFLAKWVWEALASRQTCPILPSLQYHPVLTQTELLSLVISLHEATGSWDLEVIGWEPSLSSSFINCTCTHNTHSMKYMNISLTHVHATGVTGAMYKLTHHTLARRGSLLTLTNQLPSIWFWVERSGKLSKH